MKPIVHYIPSKYDFIREDVPATICKPVDHPTCSNNRAIITSKVIAIDHNGFETKHSIYRHA